MSVNRYLSPDVTRWATVGFVSALSRARKSPPHGHHFIYNPSLSLRHQASEQDLVMNPQPTAGPSSSCSPFLFPVPLPTFSFGRSFFKILALSHNSDKYIPLFASSAIQIKFETLLPSLYQRCYTWKTSYLKTMLFGARSNEYMAKILYIACMN